MYQQELTLNNLQWLIYHKTQRYQTHIKNIPVRENITVGCSRLKFKIDTRCQLNCKRLNFISVSCTYDA